MIGDDIYWGGNGTLYVSTELADKLAFHRNKPLSESDLKALYRACASLERKGLVKSSRLHREKRIRPLATGRRLSVELHAAIREGGDADTP